MEANIVDIVSDERTPLSDGKYLELGQGDLRIRISWRDDRVEVSSIVGGMRLAVYPVVSNVIRVGTIR